MNLELITLLNILNVQLVEDKVNYVYMQTILEEQTVLSELKELLPRINHQIWFRYDF